MDSVQDYVGELDSFFRSVESLPSTVNDIDLNKVEVLIRHSTEHQRILCAFLAGNGSHQPDQVT